MIDMKKYVVSLVSAVFFLAACSTEDDLIEERLENNPEPDTTVLQGDPGTVDFSKYVAIGNSLTAGLMDAALYTNGQANAFPAILANHFRMDGLNGGDFNQPDINAANGFNISLNDFNNPSNATYGRMELNLALRIPTPTPGDPITPYEGDRSQLNNFGVPGARVLDAVFPGFAQFNPFFARFASSPNASMIGDATAAGGTFFTVWLGGNDVLAWANSGGAAPDGEIEPDAQSTNPSTLTSIGSFTQAYGAVINSLLSVSGARGVAITIPSITLLPYFRAVAYNPVPLEQANADALNAAYQQYNNGLDAAVALGKISADEAASRKIAFTAGPNNPVVMIDEDLSEADISAAQGAPEGTIVLPKIRQSAQTDLLLLPIALVLGQDLGNGPYGLQEAVGDQLILTLNEQIVLNTRLATFNAIIAQTVAATGGRVALLDINQIFANVAGLTPEQATQLGMSPAAVAAADGVRGIMVDGVNLQPDFSPNGIISTDGIHPNPKGHALIANEIVHVINEAFDADIPPVDTTPFRTVIVAAQ